ncbi:hypothetical protein V6N13_104998 [Hibiscus sabdariffa]
MFLWNSSRTVLLAPDSINVASNFDMLKWRDSLIQEWCSSPLLNRLLTSVSNVDMAAHSQLIPGGTTTSSLESLYRLLSATNTNTDTSVDDDEISMIFSYCKRL